MAISANSYGTVAEVTAVTRHLLDGAAEFGNSTRPQLTEIEKFIDRVSGVMNVALSNLGFSIPVSQATAKLALDEWVVSKAAVWVELTQRGSGYDDFTATRTPGFESLYDDALAFAENLASGIERLGATRTYDISSGLAFTADTPHEDRADPDNTDREQPIFRRRQWDNGT